MTIVIQLTPVGTTPPKNLLQIVQEVRGRLGQPIPGSVVGSSDPSVIQLLGLLQEFVEDLMTRKYWQSNIIQGTWVATGTEDQGDLDTLFPLGYEGLVPDTFFDQTQILPIRGGLTAAEWATRKAQAMTGPLPAYRIRNNRMLFNPPGTAGHTIITEYYSSYFIYNPADPIPVYRKYWLKDTDVCVLGDTLPMAYLKWAWKAAKGMDYAEDFRKYEMLVNTKSMRDDRKGVLNMGDGPGTGTVGPGILVSPGSWNQ